MAVPTPSELPAEAEAIARLLDCPNPKVVILVGAGVSKGATGQRRASWDGLLLHGLEHLGRERLQSAYVDELRESLDAAFAPFDLQEVLKHAETVETNLKIPSTKAFSEWLRIAFEDFHAQSDPASTATLTAIRDLAESGALIMTTNYDGLLSEATGLEPVTWEQDDQFLEVMTRQASGILHVHGHWRRPSSVVLGKTSYDRVVNDSDFQQLLRTLWLTHSWIYVGCGNGIDDPNLGRLLEWGARWGDSTLQDFILGRQEEMAKLRGREDKPINLTPVGFDDYDDLPRILTGVTPVARSWPFTRVDEDFSLFRIEGTTIPFPTREEYITGEVPGFESDLIVAERLEKFGWAAVIDLASVGKTTLALRQAMSIEQRNHPTFYLDLKEQIPDEEQDSPERALRRLSRSNTLIILDNVHHQVTLARRLWHQWSSAPGGSRLLIVGTMVQAGIATTPDADLAYFVSHPKNPAVLVKPTPEDLRNLSAHIYRRIVKDSLPVESIPIEQVRLWHRDYHSQLNAFTIAVTNSLADFRRGEWELPLSRASDWVREKWLEPLSSEELENVVCLAAYSEQELEIQVPRSALPFPTALSGLQRLGLLEELRRGQFGEFHHLGLREPGWGRFILTGLTTPVDVREVRFQTAARDLFLAILLGSRLRRDGRVDELGDLWSHLARNLPVTLDGISTVPIGVLTHFAKIISSQWSADDLNAFWLAIEKEPEKVAHTAWSTSLESIGSFMIVLKEQGRETAAFWDALEKEPERLGQAACSGSLDGASAFLRVAKQQGRDTGLLWKAIESEPERVAEAACSGPLDGAGAFMRVAKQQGRDIEPLWRAIERDPGRLAEAAWSSRLDCTGSFLRTARQQGRDTGPLWEALESEPGKLAQAAWSGPIDGVSSFLNVARQQGRDLDALWEAIEKEPDKLLQALWSSPLDSASSFLGFAKQQGRDTAPVWKAMENEPEKLAQAGSKATLNALVGFTHHAPESVNAMVLEKIEPGHWVDASTKGSLIGAAWLSRNCADAGRIDLSESLCDLLLRRKNWRDFPPKQGGFTQVCLLLSDDNCSSSECVASFLQEVVTSRWLASSYANTRCGQLATGLMAIALHCGAEMCESFHHPGLGWRIGNEVADLASCDPDRQGEIVQLVGCAQLAGWRIGHALVEAVPEQWLAEAGLLVMPHREEAVIVERYQMQFWMGLRSVVSATNRSVPIAEPVLTGTISLWNENLRASEEDPASRIHALNTSMVEWLEACCSASPPSLVPSESPLWLVSRLPQPA